DRFGFDETVYLLLTGELPSEDHLNIFSHELALRRSLPKEVKEMILSAPQHGDQMGSLHTVVSAMHMFDRNPNSMEIKDVTRQCIDLIAKFPTIVAYNYQKTLMKKSSLKRLLEPDRNLSSAANFLYMLSGKRPDKASAELFDTVLIFHAEHGGGNNSTFSTRCVSSSGANTYMAICAGIGSLSGPLHGGANEAVARMMDDIK